MVMWLYEVDLHEEWNDYKRVGFEEFRDRVVEKLQDSYWYHDSEYLAASVSALQLTETSEEFEDEFELIWDLADEERCWIATF